MDQGKSNYVNINKLANRFADKNYFHNVRAIRTKRLKPALGNLLVPRNRDSQKGGSIRRQEPSGDSRESPDSHESANRFGRIGPLA